MKPNRNQRSRKEALAETALFKAVLELENVEEAKDFFHDLCTPAEMQALVDRWMVVGPLIDGEPYREISQKTGVSVTTIGRVARFLTQGNGGYQRIFHRLKRSKSTTNN